MGPGSDLCLRSPALPLKNPANWPFGHEKTRLMAACGVELPRWALQDGQQWRGHGSAPAHSRVLLSPSPRSTGFPLWVTLLATPARMQVTGKQRGLSGHPGNRVTAPRASPRAAGVQRCPFPWPVPTHETVLRGPGKQTRSEQLRKGDREGPARWTEKGCRGHPRRNRAARQRENPLELSPGPGAWPAAKFQ